MLPLKIINASHTHSINKYMKVKHKLLNCNANIYFNKICIDQQLAPNYTHIKIKQNTSFAAKRTEKEAQKLWIKNKLKFLYRKKLPCNYTC
jgi:hypothetical protein